MKNIFGGIFNLDLLRRKNLIKMTKGHHLYIITDLMNKIGIIPYNINLQ